MAQTFPDAAGTPPSASTQGAEEKISIQKIRVTGATIYSAATLEALVNSLDHGEHTLAELQLGVERINAFYRADGWTLARAYLPTQTVRNGEIEIRVLEGALSEVHIDNQSRLRTSVLEARLAPIPRSAPLNQHQLDRTLLLLSDVSGTQFSADLAPGVSTGLTDLRLSAQTSPLLAGRLEVDNYGSQYLGRVRTGGKFALNNPLGYGEQFSLHVLGGHSSLFFGNISAQVPLGFNGLGLGASVTRTQYRLGSDFAQLDATGSVRAAAININYAWIRSLNTNLSSQISVETRALQDKVNATETVIDKHAQHASLDLTFSHRSEGGSNNLAILRFGTGHLALDNEVTRAIDAASAQTAGRYNTLDLELQRTQPLLGKWEAYVRWHGQAASRNLDSYDKLGLGGPNGVRAYPSGEATGDQGWLSQVEIRYTASPMLIPSVFWDTGAVLINKNPFLSGDNHRRLEGAGLGIRGSYQNFDWQAWLAWRRTNPAQSEKDMSPRAWIQGGWAF